MYMANLVEIRIPKKFSVRAVYMNYEKKFSVSFNWQKISSES